MHTNDSKTERSTGKQFNNMCGFSDMNHCFYFRMALIVNQIKIAFQENATIARCTRIKIAKTLIARCSINVVLE